MTWKIFCQNLWRMFTKCWRSLETLLWWLFYVLLPSRFRKENLAIRLMFNLEEISFSPLLSQLHSYSSSQLFQHLLWQGIIFKFQMVILVSLRVYFNFYAFSVIIIFFQLVINWFKTIWKLQGHYKKIPLLDKLKQKIFSKKLIKFQFSERKECHYWHHQIGSKDWRHFLQLDPSSYFFSQYLLHSQFLFWHQERRLKLNWRLRRSVELQVKNKIK